MKLSSSSSTNPVLCILFSSGGTADVGRHAVQAALEQYDGPIRVLTKDPQVLQESNWNCACPEPHHVDCNDWMFERWMSQKRISKNIFKTSELS